MTEQQKYVFRVKNKHSTSMGEAPEINANTPNRYHGYFENEFGEQAIFVYDYDKKAGTLWMGDAGWSYAFEVVDGDVPELELGMNEKLWLQVCWNTAVSVSDS